MVERLRPTADTRTVHAVPQPTSNRFVDLDTILFFFGQLKEKAQARKAAAKAYAGVRKQFKNAGVSLNIFDIVENLADQDDPEAIQNWMDEFLHIASAFQTVPAGTQFDIFSGPGNAVDADEKAYESGRMRGLSGQQPDSQAYPETTPLGQRHLEGWYKGQEALKEKFVAQSEAAQKAEAEKEAEKKAAAAEKAKKKADKQAAAAEKAKAKAEAATPKTDDGETIN